MRRASAGNRKTRTERQQQVSEPRQTATANVGAQQPAESPFGLLFPDAHPRWHEAAASAPSANNGPLNAECSEAFAQANDSSPARLSKLQPGFRPRFLRRTWRAREHFVQHAAKRKDVRARVDRSTFRLLGRHVCRSSQNYSGIRRRHAESSVNPKDSCLRVPRCRLLPVRNRGSLPCRPA